MNTVCLNCKHPIEMPDVPSANVMNMAGVSIIVQEHPDQVLCPNCGVTVTAIVMGVNLALAAAPVPPKQQKSIILAPDGGPLQVQ